MQYDFESFNYFMQEKYSKLIDFDLELYEKSRKEEKHIYIYRIFIKKENRRMGIGKKFMLDICQFSDCNNLIIKLAASPLDSEINEKRLFRFYRKFGFRKLSKCNTMRRTPKINIFE